MFRLLLILTLLVTARAWAAAPPLTFKDVALMARSGYSEKEILTEARIRRLVAGVNAEGEKVLREGGVPDALIEKLKAAEFQLSPAEDAKAAQAAAAQRAATMQREQTESSLIDQRRKQAAQLAAVAAAKGNMMRLLDGKLVHLKGSALEPYPASNLADTRLFAFYYACNWTAKCRETTTAVTDWYRRIKPAHPEFELIFVSRDKSEMTMTDDVRKYAMPFPAVRFDAIADPGIQQFGGSMPWLTAVSRSGVAVISNIDDKKYIEPAQALMGLDYILAEMQKPGAKLKGE